MPSAPVFQRYFGAGGAIAYIVAVGVIVALLPKFFPALVERISSRAAVALGIVALIAITVLFAVAYPRLNTHEPGTGSDRDDALNVGVDELLHGRYPYYAKTYLDAPISPAPGALLQSVPFRLLGNAAYQNFFWLIAFALAATALLDDARLAIGISLITLILSPTFVVLEIATGGDFLANSLYVLTAASLMLVGARKRNALLALTAAAMLGFLLSSRAVYLFVIPITLAAVVRWAGWRMALGCGVAIVAALLAVSLPFYLHDPPHFTPLAAQNKYGQFESILPHADTIAAATMALLAIGLSLWLLMKNATTETVMASCAVVLIYPALLGVVLDCLTHRRLTFEFAGWASCGTFFAALALSGALKPSLRGAASRM